MLTELATLKSRLALDPLDLSYDPLLSRAILAISARFDLITHRTLARTENAAFEFPAHCGEILVPCYPLETVSKWETKLSESEGWIEVIGVEFVIRRAAVLSLAQPLPAPANALARVTYTGGYVLPGDPDIPGAARLPAELEQAAVEQAAFWFQTRDKLGVIRQWPKGGSYEQFADPDLLPSVRDVLERYTRLLL